MGGRGTRIRILIHVGSFVGIFEHVQNHLHMKSMAVGQEIHRTSYSCTLLNYHHAVVYLCRSSDRKIGGKNMGSKHRGVTHHARTNRYEAHIWDDGRQVYLGGFYNEAQAALAYDLAAVRFRGEDSTLNYPRGLYTEEMQSRHTVTQEQVVTCLRDQSKSMNKVDQSSKAVSMQAWELQLSRTFILCISIHVYVYA